MCVCGGGGGGGETALISIRTKFKPEVDQFLFVLVEMYFLKNLL